MTNQVDYLVLADWVLPMAGSEAVLTNSGVAVDGEKIIAIDTHENLIQQFPNAKRFELKNQVLMPGLVNAHTHSAMNLLKGFADDLPLMTWLQDHIWPAEQANVSNEFVYQGSKLAIAEMLKSGTTCFNDMYFMPNMTTEAALEIGVRAIIGMVIMDFPTAWGNDAEDYINKGLAVFHDYKSQAGIRFSFAPHAPYTVSDEPLKKIATLAEELDLGIHMHVHETQQEVEDAVKETGERPLNRLLRLGLLSPLFQAVHMTELSEDDIQLVARHGVQVIHCPESNMKLASGICPTQALLDESINLAIGTDGSASNNDLDMFGEMRSASLLAKVGTGNASALSAYDTLKAATLGGAKVLGIDKACGSLELNKDADMIAVNLRHIATQPIFDPVSHIVYSTTRDQVSHVWTRGKIQVENGELTQIDENECFEIANFWQQKLLSGRK